MENFNDIKNIWYTASTESLPQAAEMVRTIKDYRFKQGLRTIALLLFSLVLLAVMVWVITEYHSVLLSTRLGEVLMIIAIFIIISSKLKAFKRVASLKYSNHDFLQYLKQEQIRLVEFQNRTQAIGFGLASAGLLLYAYEILYTGQVKLVVGYLFLIGFLILLWFKVRPGAMKQKTSELDQKIKTWEKISAQFDEYNDQSK